MLYFHKELKEKLKSDYQIQKALSTTKCRYVTMSPNH